MEANEFSKGVEVVLLLGVKVNISIQMAYIAVSE